MFLNQQTSSSVFSHGLMAGKENLHMINILPVLEFLVNIVLSENQVNIRIYCD